MTQHKKSIPNPNKISHTEQNFISKEEMLINLPEEKCSKWYSHIMRQHTPQQTHHQRKH